MGCSVALPIPRPPFPPRGRALFLWRRALRITGAGVATRMGYSRDWVAVLESARFPWSSGRRHFDRYCEAVERAYHQETAEADAAARVLASVLAGEDVPVLDGRRRLRDAGGPR